MNNEMSDVVYDEMLDAPMNVNEIKQAVAKLKSGKTPGLDEIPRELPKAISGHILPLLTKFCNVLHESQNFPQEKLYKTGDKLDYGGIS